MIPDLRPLWKYLEGMVNAMQLNAHAQERIAGALERIADEIEAGEAPGPDGLEH